MNIPAIAIKGHLSDQHRSENSATGWEFFENVYCITLSGRPDRRKSAEEQFAKVGLLERVQFKTFEKHPSDAEEGIFTSHRACVRDGLSGSGPILVFEDDVEFYDFSPARLARAVRFLSENSTWQAFFFGCIVKSSKRTPFKSILKIKLRCSAHAYVLQRQFAEQVAAQPWTGVPIDDLLRRLLEPQNSAFAIYPAFAFQTDSPSDNTNTLGIDRARRLLGGMRRLQRWNEFSTHHLVGLIIGHVLTLVASVIIVYMHYH